MMEYGEYKGLRKRMESARKFVRIARTMVGDISLCVTEEDDSRVRSRMVSDAEALNTIGNSIDACIESMDMRHAMKGRQLSLFDADGTAELF